MSLNRLLFITVQLLYCSFLCYSQKQYHSLPIGDTISIENVPPFKDIINAPHSNFSLTDLRGKLVILDFWSTGCSSCIAAIPHLEKLQNEFKNNIQIIMIDPWETKEKIEHRLSEMKIRKQVDRLTVLPNVYGDTIWRVIFPHAYLPHHVWIDKNGKIIATTNAENATEKHIEEVLNNETPDMSVKNDVLSRGYDVWKSGFMKTGDSSLLPLFYSALIKNNFGFSSGEAEIIDSIHHLYKRAFFNLSILDLYKIAYRIPPFGDDQRIIMEVKDSTIFYRPRDPNDMDKWSDTNSYSYEIAVPMEQKDSMYNYMQSDLNRFWGAERHISAKMETKIYPSFVLQKLNNKIFKSDFGKEEIDTSSFYKDQNKPFRMITGYLKRKIENLSIPIGFVDETNIDKKKKVSMYLPKSIKDKENLKKILQKQGLDISLENRPIDVLVIEGK